MRDERDPRPGGSSKPPDRDAEDRSRRGAHRLRPGRVGAARPRARRRRRTRRAARSSVPTLPGIRDVPQRERRRAAFRAAGRRAGTRRSPAADARASTPPRAAPSATSSPATSRSTGSSPAARPASTRSSPSTANSPSLSRQRRSWSLRTSLSRSLSREVISCRGRRSRRPGVPAGRRRLCRRRFQASSAALACSAIAPNAAGSLTARSASTLRSSSMPAFAQPCTNWLYESPFARAAALIRVIQSLRNSASAPSGRGRRRRASARPAPSRSGSGCLAAPVALRLLEDLAALLLRVDGTLDAAASSASPASS